MVAVRQPWERSTALGKPVVPLDETIRAQHRYQLSVVALVKLLGKVTEPVYFRVMSAHGTHPGYVPKATITS